MYNYFLVIIVSILGWITIWNIYLKKLPIFKEILLDYNKKNYG